MEQHQHQLPGDNDSGRLSCSLLSSLYSEKFLAELESLETHVINLNPGDKLFRQGDPAGRFYLILDGCCKESHVDPTGYQSIVEFYYCNEFIGLESLGDKTFHNTAEAITSSRAYAIPYPSLHNDPYHTSPELKDYIWGMMGLEIVASRRRVAMHKLPTADQKLASFLLAQLDRVDKGLSTMLSFPMSKQDMANHLGMAPETLSRLLARFEAHGLIHATQGYVEIIKHNGLAAFLDKD